MVPRRDGGFDSQTGLLEITSPKGSRKAKTSAAWMVTGPRARLPAPIRTTTCLNYMRWTPSWIFLPRSARADLLKAMVWTRNRQSHLRRYFWPIEVQVCEGDFDSCAELSAIKRQSLRFSGTPGMAKI
jgi:hypothetical protein